MSFKVPSNPNHSTILEAQEVSGAVSARHPKPMLTQQLEVLERMDHRRFPIPVPASLVLLLGERGSSNLSCVFTGEGESF